MAILLSGCVRRKEKEEKDKRGREESVAIAARRALGADGPGVLALRRRNVGACRLPFDLHLTPWAARTLYEQRRHFEDTS